MAHDLKMQQWPREHKEFIKAIERFLGEVDSKKGSKEQQKAARVNLTGFITMCLSDGAEKARERCIIPMPDGSRARTFLQPPPGTLRITPTKQKALQKARTPARFVAILALLIESQLVPRLRKPRTPRIKNLKPTIDPLLEIGRLDEQPGSPPPQYMQSSKGTEERHAHTDKRKVRIILRRPGKSKSNHGIVQGQENSELNVSKEQDQLENENTRREEYSDAPEHEVLGRLISSINRLEKEIALIPSLNWETYKGELVRFFGKDKSVQGIGFQKQLRNIMSICYLPEELEVLETRDWDRLEAVLTICVVLAEATGDGGVRGPAMQEAAKQWMTSKMMDIEYLRNHISVSKEG